MLTPISNVHHLRELSESEDDALRFHNSLQELRGLRSHIHHAADYCEMAFLKSKDKKTLMDNTKEYICRAVVTVVDHIGTVSHNLNCRLANTDRVSRLSSESTA
ncbi:hypothetical protein Nepgr_025652 [Nepenthes gracilis]|uniref:Uncharacterized protein n=1 Tax=Nepenthes gracilis TaxID=150966 RepID=A0AAD3T793_NEPGR|nr:hypothetical protein Nepgr_025652 [Nepenthes gracilis]